MKDIRQNNNYWKALRVSSSHHITSNDDSFRKCIFFLSKWFNFFLLIHARTLYMYFTFRKQTHTNIHTNTLKKTLSFFSFIKLIGAWCVPKWTIYAFTCLFFCHLLFMLVPSKYIVLYCNIITFTLRGSFLRQLTFGP